MPAELNLEKIISEYGDSVFRMCYLYLRDYHLAEDAVQETFIKVMKNYDSFERKSSEKTWIMRIAINTCKNIMRTRWFVRLPLSEFEKVEISKNPMEQIIERAELSKAIMELSAKDREVILLYYYQELKIKEIAEIIGKSENVVAQRLKRARMKLRNYLEKEAFEYE